MRVKNIVWVDKCISIVNTYYSDYFEENYYKIHSFDKYEDVLSFLQNTELNIDMVVSNYCSFFWCDLPLRQGVPQDEICYSLYDKISTNFPQTPFVLFSSFSWNDERTNTYTKNKMFFSVSKSEHDGLEQIKKILLEEERK